MGISAHKLVYDFERKSNSANSSQNQNYRIVDIVSYLNEALEIWFENKVYVADTSDKIRNDLRPLEVKKKKLSLSKVDEDCYKAKYPKDFYKKLNLLVKACNKDCCPGITKELIPKIVQSDDLQIARQNKYWKADFKWNQLLADESGDYIYLYHDCEMDINEVFIDYYRKPKHIQAPELVECEGHLYVKYDRSTVTLNVDLEIDSTFANREISDVAHLLAARDSGNPSQFESQLKKILQIDRLYK